MPIVFVTPPGIEPGLLESKSSVMTVIPWGSIEEGVGLEPTNHFWRSTTFQEWLLIRPDAFLFIIQYVNEPLFKFDM